MTTSAQGAALLSPADVARRAQVSAKTVYRAIRSGDLVASRIGAHYRITEEDFWLWISGARVKPTRQRSNPRPIAAPAGRGSLAALRAIEEAA
ncbi:helix-turn-helix domain-containing protein [Gaiella occulta]|uniref:helix-turn-helix domain-containing protein n=1 Tax=Gaiella occulta TaxID=1002870 RepID=UPI000E0A7A88